MTQKLWYTHKSLAGTSTTLMAFIRKNKDFDIFWWFVDGDGCIHFLKLTVCHWKMVLGRQAFRAQFLPVYPKKSGRILVQPKKRLLGLIPKFGWENFPITEIYYKNSQEICWGWKPRTCFPLPFLVACTARGHQHDHLWHQIRYQHAGLREKKYKQESSK